MGGGVSFRFAPHTWKMKPPVVIQDFGEKVGGARKDLRGNVTKADIDMMTPEERLKLIRKDVVWPTPDYVALVKEKGFTQRAAAMVKMMRDSFPASPGFLPTATEEQKAKASYMFTALLNAAKAVTERGRTEQELAQAFRDAPEAKEYLFDAVMETPYLQKPRIVLKPSKMFGEAVSAAFVDSGATSRAIRQNLRSFAEGTVDYTMEKMLRRNNAWPEGTSLADGWLRRQGVSILPHKSGYALARHGIVPTEQESYAYRKLAEAGFKEMLGVIYEKEDEASGAMDRVAEASLASKRHATKIKREALLARAIGKPIGEGKVVSLDRRGEDYREGALATGGDYLAEFGLRGGEFGLWVNQEERQDVLNRGFDSFRDIAHVFKMPSTAISLGGDLAIAFGARGRGGWAAAHYEPERRVINLTKPSGEGCLAHEWGHALDHYLGRRATSMGLVKSIKRTEHANMLTNVVLHPVTADKTPTREEQLVREFHAQMEAVHTNTSPFTKAEVVQSSEATRNKALKYLMIVANQANQELKGRNPSPESLEKMTGYLAALRQPEAGKELETINESMLRIIDLPEIRTAPIRNDLERYRDHTVKALREYGEKKELPEDWQGNSKPRPTCYLKACRSLDESRKDPYYSLPHEMFARTFEAVVVANLQKREMRNHFLVDGAAGEAFPQDQERDQWVKTFTPLMEQLPEILPVLSIERTDFKSRNLLPVELAEDPKVENELPIPPPPRVAPTPDIAVTQQRQLELF